MKKIDIRPEYEKKFKEFWNTIPFESWASASKKFYQLMPHCFTGCIKKKVPYDVKVITIAGEFKETIRFCWCEDCTKDFNS
jgi:hypothetical protein